MFKGLNIYLVIDNGKLNIKIFLNKLDLTMTAQMTEVLPTVLELISQEMPMETI